MFKSENSKLSMRSSNFFGGIFRLKSETSRFSMRLKSENPFLSASIQGSNTYFWCVVTNELLMMDSILPRSADERDTHSHALKSV